MTRFLVTAALLAGCDGGCRGPEPTEASPPETVVLIVMDTVRSDHTSLCGYERPTTPTLQALVDAGATYTCEVRTPSTWTHPSHASLFTGLSPLEHEAIWVTESEVSLNPFTQVRPLAERFETLAEHFQSRGFQTAALSANVIVNEPSGLLQGFDVHHSAKSVLSMRGPTVLKRLKRLMRPLDPEKPLFLFINLYDAHDPYPAIPAGIPWVDPQPLLDIHPTVDSPDEPYAAFLKGTLPKEEAEVFLSNVTDAYDWGIHESDANVGRILGWLKRNNRLSNTRLVITSDHGELLGEHQKLRHGGFLYEPITRVPMVVMHTDPKDNPVFPELISLIDGYAYTKTGTAPEAPAKPHGISESNPTDLLVGEVAAVTWPSLAAKNKCVEQRMLAYDLANDPAETSPTALETPPEHLAEVCEGLERLQELPPPTGDGSDLTEALKAVGYME